MKLHPIALSILCFLAIACSPSSGKEANHPEQLTPVELPDKFYKKLKGTIDNRLAVTMDLSRGNSYDHSDTVLHGSYYYDKVGLPLSVNGYIRHDGSIELREFNDAYEETGLFKGRFTSQGVFEGTWTNPKTKKSLPFKLTEVQEGIAMISYNNLRKENCSYAQANKRRPADSLLSPWDTMCSYIDVTWAAIKTATPAVNKHINDALNKGLCGNYKTIEMYVDSTLELQVDDQSFLSMDINYGVETNDNNILCISANESTFTGGAHPNSSCFYHNFDLKTGKELEMSDIFVAGYEKALDAIAEKAFLKEYGTEDVWDFEKGKFPLNDNFMLVKGGIKFLFNQYEIGPYAAGMPEIFIPYSSIQTLVKPGNPAMALWAK